MKTEQTKHILIHSYYSEDNNRLDGLYSVYYPTDMDIKAEIKKYYSHIQDDLGENVCELAEVLEYMIGEGKKIDYETLTFDLFNCDYGRWREE